MSDFGKATLYLKEKTSKRRFFQELFTKLTEFWEKLTELSLKYLVFIKHEANESTNGQS